MTPEHRNLVMVPGWPGQPTCSELARLAAAGACARTDYVELARAIDADVMDMTYMTEHAGVLARRVQKRMGLTAAQVVQAFVERNRFDHMVARADRLGLPLALLFKRARSRRDLVLVSVWLSRLKKSVFLRPLRVDSHLKAIVNYSSVQMDIAADRLGVPPEKLHHAVQPVDDRFWTPDTRADADGICSVGAEARDYETLMRAVRGLDVRVDVAVGTTVFRTGDVARDLAKPLRPLVAKDRPPNVVVHQQIDHLGLRHRYARARVVVIPLLDVDFDAGVTAVAEAMAMGKPVIVSHTRGRPDFVEHEVNGLFVPPREPVALRRAIERLLARPEEAARMGRAGRALAETELSLDRWVKHVAEVTLGRTAAQTTGDGLPARARREDALV
jgi:glycosyltransferase involved in cell wall biosynthesis